VADACARAQTGTKTVFLSQIRCKKIIRMLRSSDWTIKSH